eukprot:11830-Heterococcus_DN1.PRE.5
MLRWQRSIGCSAINSTHAVESVTHRSCTTAGPCAVKHAATMKPAPTAACGPSFSPSSTLANAVAHSGSVANITLICCYSCTTYDTHNATQPICQHRIEALATALSSVMDRLRLLHTEHYTALTTVLRRTDEANERSAFSKNGLIAAAAMPNLDTAGTDSNESQDQ